MADWTLMSLQLKGKTMRFVQSTLLRQDAAPPLAKRHGECNRCGACCTCRVYEKRFAQCRLYPLHARDLLEIEGQCTYTFATDPAPDRAGLPEPALE